MNILGDTCFISYAENQVRQLMASILDHLYETDLE